MLRRVDEDVPPQVGEPPFEGGWVVEDLDDPELPAVVEPAGDRVALRVPLATLLFVRGLGAERAHEKDSPAGARTQRDPRTSRSAPAARARARTRRRPRRRRRPGASRTGRPRRSAKRSRARPPGVLRG